MLQGPTWASVVDVHVAPDALPELIEEVRRRVPAGKWTVWRIGPSSEPADLAERLLASGFREPEDRAPTLNVVVCVEAPAAPVDVQVRRVESFEDYVVSMEAMWEAFATPPHRKEEQRRYVRTTYESARQAGTPVSFLAYVDGRPAGVGRSVYSEHGVLLIAGSVVPWARGRGVYRALVRARWDDAAERGTPALVTHAVPTTSYPILKRIGFRDICSARRLEDPGVQPGAAQTS